VKTFWSIVVYDGQERADLQTALNCPCPLCQVPDLAEPVVALSLGALRRKIEAGMLPDIVQIRLVLDVRARRERETGFIVWPGGSLLTGP
jgi:hypothetical protein